MNLNKILLFESMSTDQAYEILGIGSESELQDIIKTYRSQTKVKHPDAGGSHEEFLELQAAYDKALESAKQREMINKQNPEYKKEKTESYARTVSKDLFKLANKLRRKIMAAKGNLEFAFDWQNLIAEALTADVLERSEDGTLKVKTIINNIRGILEEFKKKDPAKIAVVTGDSSGEIRELEGDLKELDDLINELDWFLDE